MSRYQGYPYVNPVVNDVPTVDAATAARWAHLPRKPLAPALPGPSGSGAGCSRDNASTPSGSRTPAPPPPKIEEDETPVVYIDLPEPNGSDVCTSIETPSGEPEYVQNTFLYDPFENKRINVPKEDARSTSSSECSQNDRSSPITTQPHPNVEETSFRGNYGAPSPSRPPPPSRRPPPPIPGFMEKESFIYGGHSSDGFPLSPIPVSEFPEPPPAYTEVAEPIQKPNPSEPARSPDPPRTQVIVPVPDPVSPVGVMSYNRKYLTCQHCNTNVHTLVIRENGCMTYVIALILFCIFLPLFVIVYFCDCFKHKNHYCPNCNKLIGFELPIIGSNIHIVNP